MRGDYGYGGGHAWNVVQFNNQYFIVDVMMYPSRMIHESAAVAEAYKRMGQNEKGGMGGKSIID